MTHNVIHSGSAVILREIKLGRLYPTQEFSFNRTFRPTPSDTPAQFNNQHDQPLQKRARFLLGRGRPFVAGIGTLRSPLLLYLLRVFGNFVVDRFYF